MKSGKEINAPRAIRYQARGDDLGYRDQGDAEYPEGEFSTSIEDIAVVDLDRSRRRGVLSVEVDGREFNTALVPWRGR